jgi:hypothetical protein
MRSLTSQPVGGTHSNSRSKNDWIQHVVRTVFCDDLSLSSVNNYESLIHVIDSELPLIQIDQFLSPDLCQAILDYAQHNHDTLRPSLMGSSQEVTQERTSSTLWIEDSWRQSPQSSVDMNRKDHNEAIWTLAHRTSQLVGLPISHFENLQLVRYCAGQQFAVHTDHIQEFNQLECRGRLATCLLYLNDSYPDDASAPLVNHMSSACSSSNCFIGGETYFPEFDARIQPKQGRAIHTIQHPGHKGYHPLMNLDVNLKARHAGSPVLKGEKYICNFWIHPVPLFLDS